MDQPDPQNVQDAEVVINADEGDDNASHNEEEMDVYEEQDDSVPVQELSFPGEVRARIQELLVPVPQYILDLDNDDDEDDEHVGQPPQPSLINYGYYLQAMRHPLRLTRQFRINYSSQPTSEDEEDNTTPDPALVENFDTDLPAEHSYLGSNMSRVSGVNYLEAGKICRMLLFSNKSILFPGETMPMILPHYMFDSTLDCDEEGIQFGLMFPCTGSNNQLYGVTCQIYEKGTDESGHIILKSKARQRFVLTRKDNPNFDEIPPEYKVYAYIRILPEIYLPDPLSSINLGSLNRFRGIPSMQRNLRNFQASTTAFPSFVYNSYNMNTIIDKAKLCLESYKINAMPNDPVLLSFWLGRNLLFNNKERIELFLTNCVNTRLQIINKSLDNEKFFCCARCKSKVANCSSLFAMSKHGVQSNYINPAGCIHETNTVYSLIKDATYPTGQPSEEFSWFPGYAWQIILCRLCDMHLGWKFASSNKNLVPNKFFGLSGTSLKVFSALEMKRFYHPVTVLSRI